MSPLTEVASTVDAIKQRLGPALDDLDERVRQAKRVVTRAQHVAEDGVDAAVTHIRRHPLRTVAIVAGIGAFVGAVCGLVWSKWPPRSATSTPAKDR